MNFRIVFVLVCALFQCCSVVNAQGPIPRRAAARREARQTGTGRRPVENLIARIRARRAGVASPGTATGGNYQDILADYPNVNLADYSEYANY